MGKLLLTKLLNQRERDKWKAQWICQSTQCTASKQSASSANTAKSAYKASNLKIDQSAVYCIRGLGKQYTTMQRVPTSLLLSKLLNQRWCCDRNTTNKIAKSREMFCQSTRCTASSTQHCKRWCSGKTTTDKIAKSAREGKMESPMNLPINSMYCIQAICKQCTTLQRVPKGLLISKLINQRCAASEGSASSIPQCKDCLQDFYSQNC